MEKRFFLALSLSIAVFLIWGRFFAPPPPEPNVPVPTQSTTVYTDKNTASPQPQITETPVAENISTSPMESGVTAQVPTVEITPVPERRTITVNAPLYIAQLDTQGAHFSSWQLVKHKDTEGNPIEMISPDDPLSYPGDLRVNNHNQFSETRFSVNTTENSFFLSDDDEPLSIELTAQLPSGEHLTKTFLFHPENYLVNLDVTLANHSSNQTSGRIEYLLPNRILKPTGGKTTNRYMRSGPVFWDGNDRELPKLKNIQGHIEFQNVRWAALQENYFFAALAPLDQFATGFVEPGTKSSENGATETAVTGLIMDSRLINPGD
ncbi:membrane protein insertase YidC, partial [bacterium]|nr:membrane protein insertase YidC [bacterium]